MKNQVNQCNDVYTANEYVKYNGILEYVVYVNEHLVLGCVIMPVAIFRSMPNETQVEFRKRIANEVRQLTNNQINTVIK